FGRHRPFLHHRQEQEEHAEQDRDQEVRSGRAQARDLQGRQDQVTDRARGLRDTTDSEPALCGLFFCPREWEVAMRRRRGSDMPERTPVSAVSAVLALLAPGARWRE